MAGKLAVLVLGGDAPKGIAEKTLLQMGQMEPRPLFIAADSGADHLYKLSLCPDIIVGDCDSISEEVERYFEKKGVKFIRYACKKDFGDGEAALFTAIEQGCDEIAIFAAIGNRFDFCLSNVMLPVYYLDKLKSVHIFGDDFDACCSVGEETIKGSPGDRLSILPLSPEVKGICSEGLEYPLKDAAVSFGSSLGISNVFVSRQVSVRHSSGVLLIMHFPGA